MPALVTVVLATQRIMKKRVITNKRKEQQKIWSAEWRERNREKERTRQKTIRTETRVMRFKRQAAERFLRFQHGLSLIEYEDMLKEQGYVCAICGKEETKQIGRFRSSSKSLSVDHDHTCCDGKKHCKECTRGLLCFSCNSVLGYFNDDIDLFRRSIQYLEMYKEVSEQRKKSKTSSQ